ncbi:hypothetical protein L1D27_13850 [Vibrio harveyi]|uniref:hypothetical protein n=1 Tax=Vibrio harveyi TaxID=669 RepID=UPI001EFE5C3E|nr:hypothetical protein [Vibrio harveyi]MCG9549487.1 hypothetical protein [Vibrio harveyi]
MISLEDHIAELSQIVPETDDCVEWSGVYEWLHIAGAIESISLDTIKNNSSFGWCRDADEYALARDELMQSFVAKLAIFNFVWGALESAIDIVKPPKHPDKTKRGKISNTCLLLGRQFDIYTQPIGLKQETSSFREISTQCFGFERVQERISKITDYGESGVGLYAVYELRNLFAHGSMTFPEPDGENEPNSPYNSLIDHATRIVLLSIQMLMLQHFDTRDYEIWHGGDITTLDVVLRSCHLEHSEETKQISLL